MWLIVIETGTETDIERGIGVRTRTLEQHTELWLMRVITRIGSLQVGLGSSLENVCY